jgi:sodium-dependent dicarboxylate transporter 2/3/5
MAVWWLTEVVPLGATALLPIVLLPFLGIATPRDAAAPYANEVIFLFLGGLMLAAAVQRWNAHARIAYSVVLRVGLEPRRAVLGVMIATAFISMWISNTATAAMMYPIGLAIGSLYADDADGRRTRTALMLSVAYAATLGGMGTLIGTPPNVIFAAAARETAAVPVSFVQFASVGVPLVVVLVPVFWLVLVALFRVPREAGVQREALRERRRALGEITSGARATMILFGLTAVAWVLREPKDFGAIVIPGLTSIAPGSTDTTIAITAAVMLFVIRGRDHTGESRPLLVWNEARRIPWEVLLITGGGLSLASAIERSGLAARLADNVRVLDGLPPVVLYLGLAFVVLLLSEMASNTAVAAVFMPIAASIAIATGLSPVPVMFVAALAASCGFALPVATPPNAIVFGSGAVTVRDMARAGVVLDVIGITAVALIGATLATLVFR